MASLVEESKYFIEWTASEAPVDTAAQLVHLQVELAGWQLNWAQRWSDASQRQQLGEQALAWSERVLRLSGLLVLARGTRRTAPGALNRGRALRAG